MTATARRARWGAVLPVALLAVSTTGLAAAAAAAPSPAPAPPPSRPSPHVRNLCAPPHDTVPPVVADVTLSTTSVSLSSGSRKVTITAHATDSSGHGLASGIRSLRLVFSGPRNYLDVPTKLVSGTTADGVWVGALTVPHDSTAGRWTLRSVIAQDRAGNGQTYDNYSRQPQAPTDISLQTGWDTSFTVTGVGPPPPKTVTPGQLTGFAFSPRHVVATAHAKTVRVTASFSDPQPTQVGVFFAPNHQRQLHLRYGVQLKHTTGHDWAGHLRVTRWVGAGKARPELEAAFGPNDRPRSRYYSANRLHDLHFHSVLTVDSGVDTGRPTLKTLMFSPTSVDTTAGAQKVTVTATATDARSGVAAIQASLFTNLSTSVPTSGLYPYPGLGFSENGNVNVTLHRSGTTWVGTATFPECVPSGTWRVNAYVVDRSDNGRSYTSKALTAAGLPGTLSVASKPGDIEPPEIRDATASGQDGTITLDFTEGVTNVTTSTLAVFSLAPAATRFTKPALITTMTCSNGVKTLACDGSAGLVTSDVLKVAGLSAGKEYEVFANLGSITTQLTDGNGNPMPWYYPNADVTGS